MSNNTTTTTTLAPVTTTTAYHFKYLDALQEFNEDLDANNDAVWLLCCAFSFISCQLGFVLLQGGLATYRSQVNVAFQNALNIATGTVMFFLTGFALGFGSADNGFCGSSHFALTDTHHYGMAKFVFELFICLTTSTVLCGATIGRMRLCVYFYYTCFINAIVYPIVAHWVRHSEGFLKKDHHFYDFACAAGIHLVGGVAGLAASMMLGPSSSFVKDAKNKNVVMHSNPGQSVLGTGIVIGGMFAFVGGAAGTILHNATIAVSMGVTNSAIAMCFSTTIGVILCFYRNDWKRCGFMEVIHSSFAGIVSVAGICSDCKPYEAMIIGLIGGVLVQGSVELVAKAGIDDRVGVVSMHGVCGVWGLIAVGLFSNGNVAFYKGLFHGGSGKLLGVQVMGTICIILWTFTLCIAFLWLLGKVIRLRATVEEELGGLDESEHGLLNMETRAVAALARTRNSCAQIARQDSLTHRLSCMGLRLRRVDEQFIVTLEDMELLQKAVGQLPTQASTASLTKGNSLLQMASATKSPGKLGKQQSLMIPIVEESSTDDIPDPRTAPASTTMPATTATTTSTAAAEPPSENAALWQEVVQGAILCLNEALPKDDSSVQPLTQEIARRLSESMAAGVTSDAEVTPLATISFSNGWYEV